MMAYEILHYMSKKRAGKILFMAFNFDMSKEYERVEWIFLENTMRKMVFDEKWIGLVIRDIYNNDVLLYLDK